MSQEIRPFPEPSLEEFYRSRRILVTGATGYLGTNLLQTLASVPCSVLGLTRHLDKTFRLEASAGELHWVAWNAEQPFDWPKYLKDVSLVFHLAAQTSPEMAAQDPHRDWKINVSPLLGLLEACRLADARPQIVFASTASIFGCPSALPVSECHPDHPMTVYCLHKKLAEGYLTTYIRRGWARGLSLRFSNLYGPGPSASASDRNVVNRVAAKALSGDPLEIYGRGKEIRDYLYVEDAVSALLYAGALAPEGDDPLFVLGSGEGHTIREALHLVRDLAAKATGGNPPLIRSVPPSRKRPVDKRNFIADITRFKEATGWQPRVSFLEGLERTFAALQRSLPCEEDSPISLPA